MNALSETGQLLERARKKALEICLAYKQGTKFLLFTNDLLPKHQHLFNREQMIQQISEISTSPKFAPLSLIYNRLAMRKADLDENTDKNLYLISDFQRNITDLDNFSDPSVVTFILPLVSNQTDNLYIDSCWVEIPAHRLKQEETIYVRIKNNSNQDFQNLPLNLYLNDSIKSITNFSINSQSEITTNLIYTNTSDGLKLGKLEITDFPITHDNTWYISYLVKPNINVLGIISDSNESKVGKKYTSALFTNDDFVVYDEMNFNNLQISKLNSYNTIILINPVGFSSGFLNEIRKVVENGASLIVFPSIAKDFTGINNLMEQFGANRISVIDTSQQEMSGIDFDNNFYKEIFSKKEDNPILPIISEHYKFEESLRIPETKLLWFRNGNKALSTQNFGKGKVWVFSFPINTKNETFVRDIIFVPTLYKIVMSSLPDQQMSYTIGRENSYDITSEQNVNSTSVLTIENKNSGEKFIPEKTINEFNTRISFAEMINEAGHYLLESDGMAIASLAFNYDRKESDLRYFPRSELQERTSEKKFKNIRVVENMESNFSEIFSDIQTGKPLWKYCIFLALMFLFAEVMIIRFWK